MSANWIKEDGFVFLQKSFTPMEVQQISALIECRFDEHTSALSQAMEAEQERSRRVMLRVRRMCWFRLALAPFELPLTLFMLGGYMFREKWALTGVVVRFLLGRLSAEEFNRANEHALRRMVSKGGA